MQDRPQRLKVLHVIPSVAACRGGPSKAVIEMVSHLREAGIDAEIATTNDNGPTELDVTLNTLVDYQGAKVRFFKRFSPAINAIREFAYSRSFTNWLSNNIDNYDVVHVHAIFSYCSSYAMTIARKKGTPYVVRPIGQLQQWSLQQSRTKKRLYLNIVERANLESAASIQFTADSEQNESSERLALSGTVIPLGIGLPEKTKLSKSDVMQQWELTATEVTVLYLSRLHEKKGLELLMQALARIDNADFKLLVAGDGEPDYTRKLKTLSKSLGVDRRCHFLGHVDGDNKAALLQHSDFYALTSYSENFGISVLEAMANGLAPIVSKDVALSSVISKQQLGIVCSTEIDDIETQLRFAFANQEQMIAMGLKAQQYVAEHYSWAAIATQLKSLYKSII